MKLNVDKIEYLKENRPYEALLLKLLFSQKVFRWKTYGTYLDDHVKKHPITDFYVNGINVWNNCIDFSKDYFSIKKDYVKLSKNIIDSKELLTFNTREYNQSINVYYTFMDDENKKHKVNFVTCLKKHYNRNELYISSCFWRKKLLVNFEVILSDYTRKEKRNPNDNSFKLLYNTELYDKNRFNEINLFYESLIDYFDDKELKKYIEYVLGYSDKEINIYNNLLYRSLLFEEKIDSINKKIKNEEYKIFYVDYYDLFDDICYISLLYFEDKEKYNYYKSKILNIDLNKQFEKTFLIFEYYYNMIGRQFEQNKKCFDEILQSNKNNDSFELKTMLNYISEQKNNHVLEFKTMLNYIAEQKFSETLKRMKEKYENKRGKKISVLDLAYTDSSNPDEKPYISNISQYFSGNLVERRIKKEHVIFLCFSLGLTQDDARELMKSAGLMYDYYYEIIGEYEEENIFDTLDGNEKDKYDLGIVKRVLNELKEE